MKHEYVSDAYASQLEELAHTLVTPERFGAITLSELIPDYMANLTVVDGNDREVKLTRDIYSVLGEEDNHERRSYEEHLY